MNIRSKLSLVLLLPLVLQAALATEPNQGSVNKDRAKIRSEYKQTLDTPDHIVFPTLLYHANFAAESNYATAAENIKYRLEFDTDEQSSAFLDALIQTHTDLVQEQEDVTTRMLCGNSGQRSKKQIYVAMDLLDDALETAAMKHLAILKASLDQDTTSKLTNWLQTMKLSHYHRTTEHESVWEDTGLDVLAYIETLCTARIVTSQG